MSEAATINDRFSEAGPTAVLAERGRAISDEQARAILLSCYGLAAVAVEPLPSERDQNVLVTPANGPRLVLKLANPVQDRSVPRFQTRALMHVAAVDPDLRVPRVVPTTAGDACFRVEPGAEAEGLGYLISYLEGVPLRQAAVSKHVAATMGAAAARLGRALRGFFDPAAGYELLWDLKQAGRLRPLLPSIPGERDRLLATAAVERFTASVEPRLPALRAQVIHGDLNPHNMLLDAANPTEPIGIIDFGDAVHGALVNDVAIAAAYLTADGDDPFVLMRSFIAAYHAVTPLEPDEIEILPDLIAVRQAMTCTIAGWRAERHPGNAAYILRNAEGASRGLEALSGDGADALRRLLSTACREGG